MTLWPSFITTMNFTWESSFKLQKEAYNHIASIYASRVMGIAGCILPMWYCRSRKPTTHRLLSAVCTDPLLILTSHVLPQGITEGLPLYWWFCPSVIQQTFTECLGYPVQEAVYSEPSRAFILMDFTFQSLLRWGLEGQSDFQKIYLCINLRRDFY